MPFTVSAMIDLGLVGDGVEPAEGRLDRRRVVAVDPLDVPAEGAELGREIAERGGALQRIVGLDLVVVDDDGELAHLPVGGGDQRFPDLALLQLAVAGDDRHLDRLALQPRGEHEALGLGDAHPERAGIGDHSGRADIGMAGEAVEPAQAVDELLVEHARPPS